MKENNQLATPYVSIQHQYMESNACSGYAQYGWFFGFKRNGFWILIFRFQVLWCRVVFLFSRFCFCCSCCCFSLLFLGFLVSKLWFIHILVYLMEFVRTGRWLFYNSIEFEIIMVPSKIFNEEIDWAEAIFFR